MFQRSMRSAGAFACLVAASVGPGFGANPRSPVPDLAAEAGACRQLEGKRFGHSRILAATFVLPPYGATWMNSDRLTQVKVPFCRLEGESLPVRRSLSRFEVWLPARAHWNGRFLGVGAGGSMGDVNRIDLAHGVNRGFASVATDNGHRSASWRDGNEWAWGEPQRVIDFGYRAHHLATQAGKRSVKAYYGRPPLYSYFYGCSQGGQKGMMAAQRHPEDYDGIVAGAPAYSWTGLMAQQAWSVRALTQTPASALSVPQMKALARAVLQRCGEAHGLVADGRRCSFDPGQLQCAVNASPGCLAPEQVEAVRKIYQGPITSDGRSVHPGYSLGSERAWDGFYRDVSADGSRGGGSWFGVYRYMVFEDPLWTLPRMNFDTDPQDADRKLGQWLNPDRADLGAFAKRGGRLIVYHGWADQQVPAEASTRFHERLVRNSSDAQVDRFFRLFMVPGMLHCRPVRLAPGAPPPKGPNLVLHDDYEADAGLSYPADRDVLSAMQQWVEQGIAPSHFDVRIEDAPNELSSRIVRACPAPSEPKYTGSGDPMDPRQWTCDPRRQR